MFEEYEEEGVRRADGGGWKPVDSGSDIWADVAKCFGESLIDEVRILGDAELPKAYAVTFQNGAVIPLVHITLFGEEFGLDDIELNLFNGALSITGNAEGASVKPNVYD